jgi:hypothetical protein
MIHARSLVTDEWLGTNLGPVVDTVDGSSQRPNVLHRSDEPVQPTTRTIPVPSHPIPASSGATYMYSSKYAASERQ